MSLTFKRNEKLLKADILKLYSENEWDYYLKNPEGLLKGIHNSDTLSVFDGGKLVGLIRMISDNSSVALLQDVLILPKYQRRGIGSKLVKTMLSEYKENGVARIILLTDTSEQTIKFYESLGLTKLDKEKISVFAQFNI